VETLESGALTERLRSRQFDAALSGWSAALYVDPSSSWAPDSDFNYVSYRNPRAQELLRRGLAETDPLRAQGVWREFQSVVYADQPWTFLYWTDELVAVSDRFESTTIDLLSGYRRVEDWTVPPGRVKAR
jgi:peptide/nickel transport system substrate-binding protein